MDTRCHFENADSAVRLKNLVEHTELKVERGKAAILNHLEMVMRDNLVEPREIMFHWDEDRENARWNLVVSRERNRRQISFREGDVKAWEEDILIADKYRAATLSVVDLFTRRVKEPVQRKDGISSF